MLSTCFTGLALSVAGLATAEVEIFTGELTSHAVIAGAALSLTAGSMIKGDLAAGGAANIGAGSGDFDEPIYQPNLFAGGAVTIGASSVVKDISAGAALTLGANAKANKVSVGAAYKLDAGATVESKTTVGFSSEPGRIKTTSDMNAAIVQIKSSKDALYRLPVTPGQGYHLPTTMIGGSFAPGVYSGTVVTFAANSQIRYTNENNLENPVWIFNLHKGMNVGALSTFEALVDGAGTVIWNIGGALTLGAGTDFSGVAFVGGAVSGVTSWVTCGNLYATAAVSIGSLNGAPGAASTHCPLSAKALGKVTVTVDNDALLDGVAINHN